MYDNFSSISFHVYDAYCYDSNLNSIFALVATDQSYGNSLHQNTQSTYQEYRLINISGITDVEDSQA